MFVVTCINDAFPHGWFCTISSAVPEKVQVAARGGSYTFRPGLEANTAVASSYLVVVVV